MRTSGIKRKRKQKEDNQIGYGKRKRRRRRRRRIQKGGWWDAKGTKAQCSIM